VMRMVAESNLASQLCTGIENKSASRGAAACRR
jgi:hypothetical protein